MNMLTQDSLPLGALLEAIVMFDLSLLSFCRNTVEAFVPPAGWCVAIQIKGLQDQTRGAANVLMKQ
jgi:hypothetical protein